MIQNDTYGYIVAFVNGGLPETTSTVIPVEGDDETVATLMREGVSNSEEIIGFDIKDKPIIRNVQRRLACNKLFDFYADAESYRRMVIECNDDEL